MTKSLGSSSTQQSKQIRVQEIRPRKLSHPDTWIWIGGPVASASPGWGGVYLDADVVVLRPLSGLQNAIEEAACARRRGEVKRHARGVAPPPLTRSGRRRVLERRRQHRWEADRGRMAASNAPEPDGGACVRRRL